MKKYIFTLLLFLSSPLITLAQEVPIPAIQFGIGPAEGSGDLYTTLQIVLLLTILTLAPAILLMVTSFTRIVVVLSFLRQAMGTQQMPPNQVLIGLSLFLTFFVMQPTWEKVYEEGVRPYIYEEIQQDEAFEKIITPVRSFLFKNTREKDISLMIKLSKSERPRNKSEVSTLVLIPAFMISELRKAFLIGFIIYIPFLIIDLVVASVLMSMGMMMLPPIMISLPFKLLMFVLLDGWNLVINSLLMSFNQ